MFKKYKILILNLLILNLILIIPLITPTKYVVMLPGDISEVENIITIENAYQSSGTINSTFVISYRRSTVFQKFLCENINEAIVYDEIYQGSQDLTTSEYNIRGQISHDVSITSSIISAYLSANKSIDYQFMGVYVYNKIPGFEIGDIIYGLSKDECVQSFNAFLTVPSNGIKIIRNKEIIDFYPEIIPINYNLNNQNYYYYKINDANPSFIIKPTTLSGPSGGLLQALAIYDQLLPYDYTLGLTIAGTGTINPDGEVGAIGGVKQKIYTAYYNQVDIYFIPSENYLEAKQTYDLLINPKMQLISVDSLSDAINYLEGYYA